MEVDGAWVGVFFDVDRLPLGVGRDEVADAGGVVDGLTGGSAVLLCDPLTASG